MHCSQPETENAAFNNGRNNHVPHKATPAFSMPKTKRRANQTESRNEENRKQDRSQQRADVVKREHARDQFLKFHLVLQNAKQQGDLETDKNADREDHEVKNR